MEDVRSINPVDIHVGERLRSRRRELRLTQEELGSKLGITFQQIQKYERGTNRVSASTLYGAAMALNTSPAWFFEGLPAPGEGVVDLAAVQGQAHLQRALELVPEIVDIPRLQPKAVAGIRNTLQALTPAQPAPPAADDRAA